MPSNVWKIHDDILWNSRFHGEFTNRAQAVAAYRAHLDDVRRTVPAERLLEFDVKQDWPPLCHFLGKPVPENLPFPNLNDRAFFRRVMLALRVLEWLVPALVVAALIGLGTTLF